MIHSASLPSPVLVLVDGNNLSYSVAHYDPSDPSKRHSTLLSMLRALSRVLSTNGLTSPGRVVMTWDSGLAPWRVKLFPQYKAKRAEARAQESAEDALRRDQRYIDIKALRYSVLPWLGVDQLSGGCTEGDDLILYAIDHLARAGQYKSVLIMSGDRDLDQLLTPQSVANALGAPGIYRVTPAGLWARGGMECLTGHDALAKYRVWPEDYVGVKAIIGDASDNIPGVGGCADGTMRPLMDKCGNKLENFFAQGKDGPLIPTRAKVCFTPEGLETIGRNVAIMTLRWPEEAVLFTPGARCATYAKSNEMVGLAEAALRAPSLNIPSGDVDGINFGNFLELIQQKGD